MHVKVQPAVSEMEVEVEALNIPITKTRLKAFTFFFNLNIYFLPPFTSTTFSTSTIFPSNNSHTLLYIIVTHIPLNPNFYHHIINLFHPP
jgi:hypothetical protein